MQKADIFKTVLFSGVKALKLLFLILLSLVPAVFFSGCVPYIVGSGDNSGYGRPSSSYPPRYISRNVEVGVASWYGPGFQGRPTASGTIYNMYDLTAASKTLPLNSYAYVTDISNHRSVEVLVNDRGPYVGDRIMDLSYAAARAINMIGPGTALVRIQYLGPKAVAMRKIEDLPVGPTAAVAASSVTPRDIYTLQFAAYTEKNEAIKDIDKLKRFVPGVHMSVRTVEGTHYYKVVFGRFKNLNQAYGFAKTISRYGYNIYITRNE